MPSAPYRKYQISHTLPPHNKMLAIPNRVSNSRGLHQPHWRTPYIEWKFHDMDRSVAWFAVPSDTPSGRLVTARQHSSLPMLSPYFFNNLGLMILSRILFVRLYPVSSLKSSLFPFIAAKRAFVADGAAFGRLRATLLNGKNLKAFLRFSPTIITEFGEKFSEILTILLFFADDTKVTLGNHLLKIRNLLATGRGFFILPTE